MLIAFLADIHANRQAFEACLAQARDRGAERFVLLGDYVGYGGDPVSAVETVMDLVDRGAMAVMGNHDSAVGNPSEQIDADAQTAIAWTRSVLGESQRRFLADLPLTLNDEYRFYVHADASDPKRWLSVASGADAAHSLGGTSAHMTFCAHTHQPALYSVTASATVTAFTPATDAAIPLLPGRRWLAVVGSVGQPRDGNPAASYALFDTVKREMIYCRAPYDIEAAAAQIRKHGLPPSLADRLFLGT
jgi:diadenosine tetraphosphatase ApaH/serine/threonine PP2A family protein phosphatase